MTPEAQHEAICRACDGICCYMNEEGEWMWKQSYPLRFNPLNDLNAMHEAEKTLSLDQQFEYHNHIFDLVPCDENHGPCVPDGEDVMTPSGFSMLHATAAQRAEAFLRTIGKWEDL